jgi:hypothetical protein
MPKQMLDRHRSRPFPQHTHTRHLEWLAAYDTHLETYASGGGGWLRSGAARPGTCLLLLLAAGLPVLPCDDRKGGGQ